MEILQAVESIAREKGLNRDELVEIMKEAVEKAARAKYGAENLIRVDIDEETSVITLYRVQEIVESEEEVEHEQQQITLEQAREKDKTAKAGGEIVEELPPMDFGRVAAQTAKQVIKQKVRDAEREKQYELYKDKAGEIASGIVKRVDFGNVVVDLGRAEGVIRRDEGIPRERLKIGNRVRAYIMDVRREMRGPQIFLSRSHPEFMRLLFAQEVPEIFEGIIEVKGVARDPGSRAKIAVYSNDSSIDPVGACVGMRGSRVQSVVNELHGEKIDIIPWSHDTATLAINALQPAVVSKVVMDEERQHMEIVVAEDQLSLAIGRRGQNVRLASILLGWTIDILSEEEEQERRAEETAKRSERFKEALDVDDVIARLLVAEGFVTVDDIAFIDLGELESIEGFNDAIAQELQNRAKAYVEKKETELTKQLNELNVSDELIEHPELTLSMLVKLGEEDVQTLDDLGDLAGDELVEIVKRPTRSLWRSEKPGLRMKHRKSQWIPPILKQQKNRLKNQEKYQKRMRFNDRILTTDTGH